MDLVGIRFEVIGGKESAAEASLVSKEVAGTGTAAQVAGKKSAIGAKGVGLLKNGVVALGRAAKVTAVLLGVGLVYEAGKAVNAFRESRKVSKQTQAVIKSTGGAANVTAGQVANLAGNLSLKTGVDDEVIQSGANMILTFKNIRNEVGKNNDIFNQAVSITNDMAAALGTEPKKNAILLGKALNDPIAGLTALTRVGVTFDEQTKANITSLVEQGKTMQAQKIILKELNSEFGGSARANSDAFDRMGVAWENLEEKAGKVLFPVLTKGARYVTDFLTEMIKGRGEGGKFATAIGRIGPVFSSVKSWISGAVTSVRDFFDSLGDSHDLTNLGTAAVTVGKLLFGVFKSALKAGKTFLPGIKNIFTGVVKVISGVVDLVSGIIHGDWAQAWEGAKRILSGAVHLLIGITQTLTAPFRNVFNTIKNIVGSVIGWIEDKINDIVSKLEDAKNKLESLVPGGTAHIDLGNGAYYEGGNFHTGDTGGTTTGGSTDADGGRKPRYVVPPATPKAAPNTGNGRGGKPRQLIVQVPLNGKVLAETVLNESQIAAALG